MRILQLDSFPDNPKNNTWVLLDSTRQVWAYNKGKWKVMARYPVDSIYACGSMPMLKFQEHLFTVNLDHTEWEVVDDKWCGDQMTVVRNLYYVHFYDKKMKHVAQYTSLGNHPSFQPMQVQGMDAFCAPVWPKKKTVTRDAEYEQWGILGTNGRWLIEPQFDKEFHFENGTAEVLLYGQQRKINEKGELVD